MRIQNDRVRAGIGSRGGGRLGRALFGPAVVLPLFFCHVEMHGGVVVVWRGLARLARVDQRALWRSNLTLGRLECWLGAALARQMAAGVVLADVAAVAVAVAVLADPQNGAGGSIALDSRARAAGGRCGVAREGAAVVLSSVAVTTEGVGLRLGCLGLLGLLVQLVEIGADGVISLHAAATDDVLARGLCFVL